MPGPDGQFPDSADALRNLESASGQQFVQTGTFVAGGIPRIVAPALTWEPAPDEVYLELPDGGLHDLEQRIDQLQHMQVPSCHSRRQGAQTSCFLAIGQSCQVSYMSERLGTLTEDLATAQASIAGRLPVG